MFEWRGFMPAEGRSWRYNAAQMDQLYAEGRIVVPKTKTGTPGIMRYLDEG